MNKIVHFDRLRFGVLSIALIFIPSDLYGQNPACQVVKPHPLSPAEKAYSDGFYVQAEQLYSQALAQQPQDAALAARLIEALLHQNKVAQAAEQLKAAISANPNSAAILTAAAEVQFRQGQPWLAMNSLEAAATSDPCYARVHLVRSQIFHIDSKYESERSELQKAYEIDITDPDTIATWSRIMPAVQEIEGTVQALNTMKDLDAETRNKAEVTVQSLMQVLSENSQTCKILPTVPSAAIPLLPSSSDDKHIDGFRVEVGFLNSSAKLQLDTAASGLYVSRALADQNGFQRAMGAPMETVQADTVRIGSLEFHDCIVGVSETPFPDKADGVIGTDLLSSYLITINARYRKLNLDPLPPQPGVLPRDRSMLEELAGYQPVYHRRQYLLIPVTVNKNVRKLFALDTGMRMSTMNSETARLALNTSSNSTLTLPTKSGRPFQVYRDEFDLQFAGLSMNRQADSILALEPDAIDHNTGLDVAGMLGFDIFSELIAHLDYRDGLVKFETTSMSKRAGAKQKPQCLALNTSDFPLSETLELKITGTLDSAHLKPGKKIYGQVVHGVIYPECTLNQSSMVYGHVTAASSLQNPNTAELDVVFDHGDCEGQKHKELSLHVIALLAPPDQSSDMLHNALPTEVVSGARRITDTVRDSAGYDAPIGSDHKPSIVHPGLVVGLPKIKLTPLGGPSCSARITSSTRSVQLGTGTELILLMSTNTQPTGAH